MSHLGLLITGTGEYAGAAMITEEVLHSATIRYSSTIVFPAALV